MRCSRPASPASSPGRWILIRRTEAGSSELRAAGVEVELVDSFEARAQNEAWRTWVAKRRPFVTYKAAVTLDGRMTVPGERWVSGEESRRLVHELRAASDAVAVGMGTVRADDPRLDARGVDAVRQPRRVAFGQGPLPEGSELELLSGPLEEELGRLAEEGVQSLLLEGGPTLAASFFAAGLVDKLMLFVAPKLSGEGPGLVSALAVARDAHAHEFVVPSGKMFFSRLTSTSPEAKMRTDDRVIRLISQWLGGHLGNAELLRGIEESDADGLAPGQAEAVARADRAPGTRRARERGELQMVARETLEALALGE